MSEHFPLTALRVNGERLWSRLMQMAEIGATASGGCNRQALTDGDMAGRQLLTRWAEAAGCRVRTDGIGNLFIRRPGREDSLPVVMTGSHLDTQPTGGKFDGVYGVLAGLEVIESLNDRALATAHPIELSVWCNEEGSRFPMAMMGSAVWSGRLGLDAAYALTDRAGISVRQELERAGVATGAPLPRQPVRASFEVHIEQGPVLEQKAKTIGVVTGVQHMSRHEVIVEGQEAHAGPTPMDMRRDPIRVLAEVLPALYAAAEQRGRDARLTVGIIETFPGSPNTVPGRLRFTVDLRHPDARQYAALKEEAARLVHGALARHALKGSMRCVWEAPGVSFDPACVAAVRSATAVLGFNSMEMVSGAGHDSCNLAAVVPTSMVFVPCAGGLSHNEAESALPADLAAGADVLLHAMLSMAQRVN
ncbi:MAG TPA: Zn-dependent hydrolase [Steroidobacteraceae bacterium]|jgi:N-carbamoyl-L-amino-acid hydrolase|nr:Zn-dependent hydrolase [Steroidobacteraceae bacterium]